MGSSALKRVIKRVSKKYNNGFSANVVVCSLDETRSSSILIKKLMKIHEQHMHYIKWLFICQ